MTLRYEILGMAIRRGTTRALISAGALAILIALALFVAPPIIARHALKHYLGSAGITADIGHVHTDVLTGKLSLDAVHGHGPGGRAFRIGHLDVHLAYPALLDHRIDLRSIHLARARLNIGRDAAGRLTVAGWPVAAGDQGGEHGDWGFGVDRLAAENITLRYREPARGDRAAVDETLGLTALHLRHFATWRPEQPTAVKARLQVADGELNLDGRLRPLAAPWRAQLTIQATDFSMQALAPLARLADISDLKGTFDADQKLSIAYAPDRGLTLELDGHGRWRDARVKTVDGTRVTGNELAWQGHEQARLWQRGDPSGHITTDGRVRLNRIRVRRPGQLDFRQQSAVWKGKAGVRLARQATRMTGNGRLTAHGTRLSSANGPKLSSQSGHFNGALNIALDRGQTRIDTDGQFKAHALSFAMPDTLRTRSAILNWQGRTTIRLADHGTAIRTDGALAADRVSFDIPGVSRVEAAHADWRGRTRMRSAAQFAQRVEGRLATRDMQVDIPGQPIHFSAVRFGFNGRYASQPTGSGTPHLAVSGDAHSHKMRIMNTAIDAPWASLLETDATGIDIDGLNSIDVDRLKVSGIRLLDDKHSNRRLMQAVTLKARQFALRDLTHYALADLEIGDAIIHLRHDDEGLGVISRFLASVTASDNKPADNTSAEKHKAPTGPKTAAEAAQAGTTFAIDHAHLSGPAITFVDTTTTPAVRVHGANLDLTLDHINTARPDQYASYQIGLDAGAYGHFDSLGKIAPLAPGGPRMDLRAWLRSLALPPLSGYLNAAMQRGIENGVADGTLKLAADKGQLDGVLDTTVTNFRLANRNAQKTELAYGISLATALKLIRGRDDIIHFRTRILGDVTSPYFSIDNLIREGVLAGLRTALLSNYSPLGLLNNAKNFVLNLFRSVEDRPAIFAAGMHYVRPQDRRYLALIAKALRRHPGWTLRVTGRAVPADARAMQLNDAPQDKRRTRLERLARERQDAVTDYLAARNVDPARIVPGEPGIDATADARPAVTFSLDKSGAR